MIVNEIKKGELLFYLEDLLSKEECEMLIYKAETMKDDNYGNRSWHAPGTGGRYLRVIMMDQNIADILWSHIKHIVPQEYDGYKTLYINPCLRYSRYEKGGLFPIHYDGDNYDRSHSSIKNEQYATRSLFTLNIFLNDETGPVFKLEQGGATDFIMEKDSVRKVRYSAQPKAGSATLFWAKQLHRGNRVISGRKYLLRTDVMGIKI